MILLDTHVILWLVLAPERMSRPAAAAIRRARVSEGIAIADISLLELATLFPVGVFAIPVPWKVQSEPSWNPRERTCARSLRKLLPLRRSSRRITRVIHPIG